MELETKRDALKRESVDNIVLIKKLVEDEAEARDKMTKVALDLKEVEAAHDALLCEEVWMTEKEEMERMAAEGYVMSFWDCTMQIARKFPDHGANFE